MPFVVRRIHKDQEPVYLARSPRRSPRYGARNPYAVMDARWTHWVDGGMIFAKRETAERHAAEQQERADATDANHYTSAVGDTVITVIEIPAR